MDLQIASSSIYSLDFSPDDKFLAVCIDKGEVIIYMTKNKKCILNMPPKPSDDAITCIKWRLPNLKFQTKNIFTFSNSKGLIESYHLNTQKRIFSIQEQIDGDPQINNFEYGPNQEDLAVVGAFPTVRIYDLNTCQLKLALNGEDSIIPGHTNRLFSVKFEKESGLLISSGWDQRILFWDLRTHKPVESIFGSNIYGDGLDICEGLLLTANHREEAQIQLYDLNSRKLITSQDGSDFPWISSKLTTTNVQTLLNFGKFEHNKGKYILAGGTSNVTQESESD